MWSLTDASQQESSIHDFGELYSSGDEPHPYFEWYDSEFDTRIPESSSDISVVTLPSSPSLKWLPGAPSTAMATAALLPPLQPFNECQSHISHAVPALATHFSQHCIVEYEASDMDETDESSLACDDTLDLDEFEMMPLITAFADDDLDESSMSSSTSTASPSGWTTSFQAYNDDDNDTEPSFDMIPFGPHSPVLVPHANLAANPWTSRSQSSSSSTRAPEEAPARPARDEHSEFPRTSEKFRSEDSTRLFCADQLPADNAKQFSKAPVRRSGRPSYSTSTSTSTPIRFEGDHVKDDGVLWLESSYARSCIFRSSSQSQSSTSSSSSGSESSSFQTDGSSVTTPSFVAAAHLDATRAPARRGWLKTLRSRVPWLGTKHTLRTRVRGRNEGGG